MTIRSGAHSGILKYLTIVLGLSGSGTSMMMKMLVAGGPEVLIDHILVPDQDNSLAYYEYEDVNTLHDVNTGLLANPRERY